MDTPTIKQPQMPRGGPPDPEMVERLRWPDRWMAADRITRMLTEMTTSHLLGVSHYLRWYGHWLWLDDGRRDPGQSVERYLRTRPIWIGLGCELAVRGEITIDLYDTLRERGGLVPWEAALS